MAAPGPANMRHGRRRPRRAPGPGRGRSGPPGRRAWKAWATVAPPSTSTCSTPSAPELVEHRRRGRPTARAPGGTLAPAGRLARARPAGAGRSGPIGSTGGTVSSGSSARTVPAPTSTASDTARSRWASARAASPVIQRLVPSGAAMRPSRVAASLSTTHGRPVRRCLQVRRQLLGRLVGGHPHVDVDAGRAQRGDAPPRHLRVGVARCPPPPGPPRRR